MLRFKQYFSEENLEEGVNDPGIFKAVFLAGGPGSGKSFIVGKTAVTALGLKLVNSDTIFEKQLEKIGLKATPDNIFSPVGQKTREKSKALTSKQQELYLNGRLGLVIDGTGKDVSKVLKQKAGLEKLGYETAMIFVNTDEDTALERNRQRDRSLPDKVVSKMWKEVQNNMGTFQSNFGNNFYIVDNSENSDFEKGAQRIYKRMSQWVKEKPKSKAAKTWIDMARKK